jgi:hypothetical protein
VAHAIGSGKAAIAIDCYLRTVILKRQSNRF